MPSERLVDALNAQIDREFAAAHQYTAIGAWYDARTFPRLATFFHDQADEERGHAMRMLNYLVEAGAQPTLGSVSGPKNDFADHVAPIRLALDQERQNTVEIGKLFETARETRDHASEVFLHHFVEEQVEEEATMESLLAVTERLHDFPMMVEEFLARDAKSLGSGRSSSG